MQCISLKSFDIGTSFTERSVKIKLFELIESMMKEIGEELNGLVTAKYIIKYINCGRHESVKSYHENAFKTDFETEKCSTKRNALLLKV